MAFIDEMKIYVKAGDGGDGVVRWRHEKFKEFGGPSGGNGGNGGDVYIVGVRDVHLLSKYQSTKEFFAERGEDGRGSSEYGKNGKDLDIQLPVGSIIENLKTEKKIHLDKEGEKILLLEGGRGGRGNESFKSSINRSPQERTLGKPGEEAEFYIEVELIADIGLIGLPNAGKTSLLNTITHAKGKIGAYPFTTLEPNLGECYGYILADVPGLIEGAAEGKGLGHKFLRHIRRTKMFAHLISLENEDPIKTYKEIRKELKEYNSEFLNKKEVVILTKADLVSSPLDLKTIATNMKEFLSKNDGDKKGEDCPEILILTLYDNDSIKNLQDELLRLLKDIE